MENHMYNVRCFHDSCFYHKLWEIPLLLQCPCRSRDASLALKPRDTPRTHFESWFNIFSHSRVTDSDKNSSQSSNVFLYGTFQECLDYPVLSLWINLSIMFLSFSFTLFVSMSICHLARISFRDRLLLLLISLSPWVFHTWDVVSSRQTKLILLIWAFSER